MKTKNKIRNAVLLLILSLSILLISSMLGDNGNILSEIGVLFLMVVLPIYLIYIIVVPPIYLIYTVISRIASSVMTKSHVLIAKSGKVDQNREETAKWLIFAFSYRISLLSSWIVNFTHNLSKIFSRIIHRVTKMNDEHHGLQQPAPDLLSEHKSEPVLSDSNSVHDNHGKLFTQLLAADESGLSLTFGLGIVSVLIILLVLNEFIPSNTWSYEFLFRRGFVQYILLITFAIGSIHLFRRIPAWLRDRKALNDLKNNGSTTPGPTVIQRRWAKVSKIDSCGVGHDCQLRIKSLAEHDEAELDSSYRLTSDVV